MNNNNTVKQKLSKYLFKGSSSLATVQTISSDTDIDKGNGGITISCESNDVNDDILMENQIQVKNIVQSQECLNYVNHMNVFDQSPSLQSIATTATYTDTNSNSNIPDFLDVGAFINVRPIADDLKYKLLKFPFKPTSCYYFKNDMIPGAKRGFSVGCLDKYDWMVYSPTCKGVLCKFCVLFKPTLKDDYTGYNRVIENNRKKIIPIIKTLIYCGTHDIAIRGKCSDEGNFIDLLKFRVDSGDTILMNHFETCTTKTKYVSHRIQNEIISICGDVIRNDIISCINDSYVFSLLADETSDISGKEQLSIGIRYFNMQSFEIREEFLGFTEVQDLSAEGIANALINITNKYGLSMSQLIGLGFDGCSTMSGRINGVQSIIRRKYPMAFFYHCASHKLNLVINDQNAIPDIRNTSSTIKDIIRFFRESILRRKLIPNVPLFCETRWSEKYKSVRLFSKYFEEIKTVLDSLALDQNVNTATRNRAFQLSCATSNIGFLVRLELISFYSAIMEPVVTKLQAVSVNLHKGF
ncbi:uncharacterized protein LOC126553244 [Aphis gossypii]|uniref:uncharacterized protein LOC126553244 n=1 Tax=Aphis gossypii TaxID=80765 RepID=UPI0021590A0B|nr:uncharacterized protein LOC126553244 [Aphis gossypii]